MDIDTEMLISAVECRPILWDKFLDQYKDRYGTRSARQEVCIELKSNFNNSQNTEQNKFGELYFI